MIAYLLFSAIIFTEGGAVMRRMSDKDILKANALLAVFSVLSILTGIFLPFLPVLLPVAEYDELVDKQIVVQSLEWIQQQRGASFYLVTTEEGEQYNITGSYESAAQLEGILSQGKSASIKYYENKIFFLTKKYAEVVVADGECVVSYNNDEDDGMWVLYLITACCFLIGSGGICFVVWEIKRNRKDRARRDRQITKKYGSIKKK